MTNPLTIDEIHAGQEVLAASGFQGRAWIPDGQDRPWLNQLAVSSPFGGDRLDLSILRVMPPYAWAAVCFDGIQALSVFLDMREVELYAK